MSRVDFSLESDDALALLGGVVTTPPLNANSKPVNDGFIHLTPVLTDKLEVPAGKYVLAFQLNGAGGPVTINVKIGAALLKAKKVDPATQGYTHHWFQFVVP